MTRVLAELLERSGPDFQLHLQQLEHSAGRPNHDIRLSSRVQQAMQAKLQELGLDSHDTTGPELYAVLGERLKADERRFAAALQGSGGGSSDASTDAGEYLARTLTQMLGPSRCFALKNSVAKKLLKLQVPKKTMRALGYRSADSMLKHETAASLFAAAWLIESEQWTKKMLAAYAKLLPTDFETRPIAIEHPHSKRWQSIAESVVAIHKHSVLSFKELGTVVLLPLPSVRPPLASLTVAVITLNAINDIRASSTYLRLQQVRSNFGQSVKRAAIGEPTIKSLQLDQAVSWSTVHRYVARLETTLRTDILDPVLQAEDLVWHSVERILSRIEPSLSFWHGTGYLALLYGGRPVSCNLTDLVLSHCNTLPYQARLSQYFQDALLTELSLLYMSREYVERALADVVHNQAPQRLAAEPALA